MPPAGYPAFLQYLQSGRVSRVQGEGLSFVTKVHPTEVEGMTSLAPGLFDIAERVRSMFSHACA